MQNLLEKRHSTIRKSQSNSFKEIWKMRCKSSRTVIRDKRRESNCIKIERDKRAE